MHWRCYVSRDYIRIAIAKLGPLSYEVSLSPTQLQQIATETQRANEYTKALIAAYNACALSKQDFRDGLFRIYPGFNQTADGIGIVVTKLSQGQGLDQADRRQIARVLLALQKVAELDANNTERILLAIGREPQKDSSLVSIGPSLAISGLGEYPQTSSILGTSLASVNSSGGQIGNITQNLTLTSIPAGQVTFASLSTLPSNLAGTNGVQIGDLTQNLPVASLLAHQETFAAGLPTFPSNVAVSSAGGLTGTSGIQIVGLSQNLPLTSQPADQIMSAASLSTFPNVLRGSESATISWTSTNTLDQSVSAPSVALVRSTIPSVSGQYEFPSIGPSCQVGLCVLSVTSDLGSTSVFDVTMSGRQINPLSAPAATGSEQEH